MNTPHVDPRSRSPTADLVPMLVRLGKALGAAATPEDAGRAIADVADVVLGWDAFFLGLYDAPTDTVDGVLYIDLIAGQRCEASGPAANGPPSALTRRVLDEGPFLLLRDAPPAESEGYRFGDDQRLSASLMFAPVYSGPAIVGIVSAQSYTLAAYDQADLRLLQVLADHCGGALQRIGAQAALRESEERFRVLFEHSPDAIFLLDPLEPHNLWPIVECNAMACQLHGFTRAELIGQSIDILRVQQTTRDEDAVYLDELRRMPAQQFETWNRTKDGQLIAIECSTSLVTVGGRELVLEIDRDITTRQQIEAALRASEGEMRALLAAMTDVILVLDNIGRYLKIAPTNGSLLYQPAQSLLGRTMHDILPADTADSMLAVIHRALDTAGPVTYEYALPVGDALYWFSATVAPMSTTEVVWVARDISERKAGEQRLAHQALHDPLTGLPNRTLFFDRVEHASQRARRYPGQSFGVVFLDLDRFKVVNDSLGHALGDRVLQEVSRRLHACLRPVDTVARLGGDEFAILLDDLGVEHEVIAVAERVQAALSHPVTLDEHIIYISASMGITLGGAAQTVEELLRDADIAMYRAKHAGRARFKVFAPAMLDEVLARLKVEAELREALAKGQLILEYQPILSLSHEQVVGVEALVRWQHPSRGLLGPGSFIAVAEEAGLIVPLGQWVLRQACAQAVAWQQQGMPSFYVSVNVAVEQLRDPAFAAQIGTVLRETGLDPALLALEVTETDAMADVALSTQVLREARALGLYGIAVDDFGTGYSSLSILQQLPITHVKIDRSFVRELETNASSVTLATTIIALGHALGFAVVAEGVETPQQLAILREHDCDAAQGYLFSRPVAADALPVLLGSIPSRCRVQAE